MRGSKENEKRKWRPKRKVTGRRVRSWGTGGVEGRKEKLEGRRDEAQTGGSGENSRGERGT